MALFPQRKFDPSHNIGNQEKGNWVLEDPPAVFEGLEGVPQAVPGESSLRAALGRPGPSVARGLYAVGCLS